MDINLELYSESLCCHHQLLEAFRQLLSPSQQSASLYQDGKKAESSSFYPKYQESIINS